MAPNSKKAVQKIAKERMNILFKHAKENLNKESPLSKNYIKTLKQISEHYKVKLDKKMKAKICKNCKQPLIIGENAEIRIIAKQRRIIYRCKSCGRANSLEFKT